MRKKVTKKQLANLKPCKKGETHNPKGRPKGSKSLTLILRDLLQETLIINDPIKKQKVRKKISEIINLKLLDRALKGELKAIDMIFNRLEGYPHQSTDITSDGKSINKTIIVQSEETRNKLESLE